MKSYHFLLFSIILSPLFICAQEFVVVDVKTKESVSFANIVFLKNDTVVRGCYSNRIGKVNLSEPFDFDFIRITHVQYMDVILSNSDFPDTIFMQSIDNVLNEVVVASSNSNNFQFLGVTPSRRSAWVSPFNSFGCEFVVFIDNPYLEIKQLKSFIFFAKLKRSDKEVFFRLVFYENANGRIGQRLPYEKVFSVYSRRTKKVVINLNVDNIYLPENGFFAGLEWIGEEGGEYLKDLKKEILKNERKVLFAVLKRNSDNPAVFFRSEFYGIHDWINFYNETALTIENIEYIPVFGIEVFD
ncbi:MAG: hypothetical protein JJU02_11090 [Cryomorphaceae bacterium]|nr:hypothetical protein [Cryomorphaceae bacterium]